MPDFAGEFCRCLHQFLQPCQYRGAFVLVQQGCRILFERRVECFCVRCFEKDQIPGRHLGGVLADGIVDAVLFGIAFQTTDSLVAFSELLRHYGVDVSDKGISKWEKGYTTPSIYQLVAICYALNIKEGPSYFTKNFQKPALLNDIGQKKVAEYEMDLIASRRYQPDAEEPAEIDYIMMPVSELPVSAGLGAFLEGEMFQQIQVPASSVPAGAEFGIYVSGDSMEPRYHDGQIVWVKRCEELECGDIGIFVYDDCGYLKKYDEHTPDKTQAEFLTDSYGVVHNQPVLVSLNTKYSPILISPEQRFEVVGKVLN